MRRRSCWERSMQAARSPPLTGCVTRRIGHHRGTYSCRTSKGIAAASLPDPWIDQVWPLVQIHLICCFTLEDNKKKQWVLGSYLASLTQMNAKCYMRSTKEIKLSAVKASFRGLFRTNFCIRFRKLFLFTKYIFFISSINQLNLIAS